MVMSATTNVEDKMSGRSGFEAGSLCHLSASTTAERKEEKREGGKEEEEFSVALRPQRPYRHRDGEPRTSTSTFTQLQSFEENRKTNWRTSMYSHKAMSLHQPSRAV